MSIATDRSPALLTANQVAAEIQVNPATVRKWRREGRIPGLRIHAKMVRFRLADVLAALEKAEGR